LVSWERFEQVVIDNIVDISRDNNEPQHVSISAPIHQSLYLVAGPGSGKTTVIVLRVLKLIFVDNIDPSNIMVTTFTKKAAAQLLSRILTWGEILYECFDEEIEKPINFNSIVIGTLDSIIEEILGDYRDPGTAKPVVIEDFVSKALNIRVLFDHGRHQNEDLMDYLSYLKGFNTTKVPEMNKLILEVKDRTFHDLIDTNRLKTDAEADGAPTLCDIINDYKDKLNNEFLYDFTRLEYEFYQKINSKDIEFFEDLKFILIDEYQDTNYLQEQIYFKLSQYPINNGGSISIVGDDDQSLYRFRGATVELFQDFQERIKDQVNVELEPEYLVKNYRSTENIVNFCNSYITLDHDYQDARVKDKPPIDRGRKEEEFIDFPILGMFRENLEDLSNALASFIDDIINGDGYTFNNGEEEYTIKINPDGGSASDIALLCGSPKEIAPFIGTKKFPCLLKRKLMEVDNPIKVFNPRGQDFQKIEEIKILCGLILECIDPDTVVQEAELEEFRNINNIFNDWRTSATSFIGTNPLPHDPTLGKFVEAWKDRTPLNQTSWPKEVMLIDLVYKLITWIPYLQENLEGLVFLEAVVRAISQAAIFSYSESKITFDDEHPNYETTSIKQILKDIFVPIALGSIDIEESLIEETLPPNMLNIMSIHQSKGLEFPLVIVDVGSDIRTDHWANSHKRFPQYKTGTTQVIRISSVNMEDEFHEYSNIAPVTRSNLDRAFDDLIRQYFVAFSRAEDVLLLVGLNSVKEGFEQRGRFKNLPNISTGWDRRKNWHWGSGLNNLIQI